MTAAVQIIFVPVPVAGSSFPRVIGTRYPSQGKTKPGWPHSPQPIPNADEKRRALLDEARRVLARRREEKLWRELAPRPLARPAGGIGSRTAPRAYGSAVGFGYPAIGTPCC
jgi:hypothetical protein